jgi:hypothetical protein
LSPEAVEAPKKAKRRSIRRFTKAVTKGLKKAWKRQIQAIKDGVGECCESDQALENGKVVMRDSLPAECLVD